MNNQVQSLKENKPIPKWLIGIGLMSLVGLLPPATTNGGSNA